MANDGDAVSRRDAIRKAALAGGAIVWTTPVVQTIGMTSALAQQGTPVPESPAGCFRYMYNWCWAQEVQECVATGALSSNFAQNRPAPECQQSLLENAVGQVQTNPNCCQQNDLEGNNLQWHQVPDFDGTCVTVTGDACTCGIDPVSQVTFTVTCPDCYFADVTVLHGSRTGLNSGVCGSFSLSSSNSAGAPFTTSWTITFPSDRVPIWVKFWVGCGLSVCSPQIVPCTQSNCLPGGEPVANRVLNI